MDIKSDDLIVTLIELLNSLDWLIRRRAMVTLARIGPKAYPALAKLTYILNDNEEPMSLRRQAQDTIADIWPTS